MREYNAVQFSQEHVKWLPDSSGVQLELREGTFFTDETMRQAADELVGATDKILAGRQTPPAIPGADDAGFADAMHKVASELSAPLPRPSRLHGRGTGRGLDAFGQHVVGRWITIDSRSEQDKRTPQPPIMMKLMQVVWSDGNRLAYAVHGATTDFPLLSADELRGALGDDSLLRVCDQQLPTIPVAELEVRMAGKKRSAANPNAVRLGEMAETLDRFGLQGLTISPFATYEAHERGFGAGVVATADDPETDLGLEVGVLMRRYWRRGGPGPESRPTLYRDIATLVTQRKEPVTDLTVAQIRLGVRYHGRILDPTLSLYPEAYAEKVALLGQLSTAIVEAAATKG